MNVDIALYSHCELGESPQWCEQSRQLYFVDILQQTLWIFDPYTQQHSRMSLPFLTSAITLTDDPDHLLLISDEGVFDFSLNQQRPVRQLVPFPETKGVTRTNEAMISPQGELWFGTMSLDGTPNAGRWYVLSPQSETLETVGEPVSISNTLCWYQGWLFFADSAQGTLYRSQDRMHRRERCVTLTQGSPDGSTISQEGILWNAVWGAGELKGYHDICGAFAPQHTQPLPAQQPTSCTFGGTDFTTLFVTSAHYGLSAPDACQGALLRVTGAGQGRPAHRFPLLRRGI